MNKGSFIYTHKKFKFNLAIKYYNVKICYYPQNRLNFMKSDFIVISYNRKCCKVFENRVFYGNLVHAAYHRSHNYISQTMWTVLSLMTKQECVILKPYVTLKFEGGCIGTEQKYCITSDRTVSFVYRPVRYCNFVVIIKGCVH